MEQLVSIIIPAYNQARYLKSAIKSVLAQTYTFWECIVVDDGSTDNTFEQVHQFKHPKIKYIYQNNAGLSAARNTGMEASKGEFLSFLDSDDCFAPKKLELLIEKMNNCSDLALVAGNAALIDENGNTIRRKFESSLPDKIHKLLFGNPLHVGSVLLRREWYLKIGLFDTNLRSYEDWDFWLRIVMAGGKMESINEIVSFYRFHTSQMTRNANQMTEASFAVLKKVFDNPNPLPEWQPYKFQAFSHSYLRAAANAYLSEDFPNAKIFLTEACRLNPDLLKNKGDLLIRKFFGWSELPKVKSPFQFIKSILENLPNEIIDGLPKKISKILSKFAIEKGFESYQNQDYFNAYQYLMQGLRLDWSWVINRGVIKIILSLYLNGKNKEEKSEYITNTIK